MFAMLIAPKREQSLGYIFVNHASMYTRRKQHTYLFADVRTLHLLDVLLIVHPRRHVRTAVVEVRVRRIRRARQPVRETEVSVHGEYEAVQPSRVG